MTSGDRETLIATLAGALAERGWDDVDGVLAEFGFAGAHDEATDRFAYVVSRIERASDDTLVAVHDRVFPGRAPSPSAASRRGQTAHGLWEPGLFRLFVSHASQQAAVVSELKDELRQYGIDAYVAGDKIPGSSEWQHELRRALATCDALLAYFTQEFAASPWTAQELGFALARAILVVSVKDAVDPSGFVSGRQALKARPDNPALLARKIYRILAEDVLTKDRMASAAKFVRKEQGYLDDRVGVCCRDGERILACEYHRDRLSCVALALPATAISSEGAPTGRLGPGFREYVDCRNAGLSPAGGWYLVHEHRTWLEEQLSWLLSSRRGEPVRVLEAGVAGPVHHYTFLAILDAACRAARYDGPIELSVVDRCVLPIEAIRAVEALAADGTSLRTTDRVDLGGVPMVVRDDLREVLHALRPFRARLSTRLRTLDLLTADGVSVLGPFDGVTEHFLTTFLHAKDPAYVEVVRRRYADALRPGGVLLTAAGVSLASDAYREFVALHRVARLRHLPERSLATWDPYDLPRPVVVGDVDPTDVRVAYENSLSVFVKEP